MVERRAILRLQAGQLRTPPGVGGLNPQHAALPGQHSRPARYHRARHHTPGQGGRAGTFGALLVGAYDDGKLRWIGQVGTGFTDKMLAKVMEVLTPVVTTEPPTDDPELKAIKGATFVRPEIVCEVEYLEITKSTKKMRAPSFKGLRTDKAPEDCILEPPAVIRASGTRSAG